LKDYTIAEKNLFVYNGLMKTALVHDWLVSSVGGGENTLKAIHELFPSPIFTLLQNKPELEGSYFQNLDITSSFIQNLPFSKKHYRNYLPLFPFAIETLRLNSFDLILSSSHCVAKGVKVNPNQLHICYCHTPMRYAWDLMDTYLEQAGLNKGIKGFCIRKFFQYIRKWDVQSAKRVSHFIANSHFIAARIKKYYGVSAKVIYPPVDTDFFTLETEKEDYYITASRLVQNKRIDCITEAFWDLPNKKLLVIGDGPEKEKLEKNAPPNVIFLGEQTRENLKKYLQKAKAFLFSAIEDFGIASVEAMATGTPVIAFGKGGSLETVIPNITGLLYPEQTSSCLSKTITHFETLHFDPLVCQTHAQSFSKARFQKEFRDFVLENYIEFKGNTVAL